MRTRVLVATVILAALVVASAAVVALSQGNRNPATSGRVTIDVSRLAPGGVETTQYDVPGANGTPAPVFLVDVPHAGFLALLGRSTHLGCSVRWVAAPSYKRFEHSAPVAFEDPCGGSLFALDGACLGGPCPRGLDRFATHTIGKRLQVNLDAIIDGPPRDPTAQFNLGMP
jgi:Rieske Fe-S protein